MLTMPKYARSLYSLQLATNCFKANLACWCANSWKLNKKYAKTHEVVANCQLPDHFLMIANLIARACASQEQADEAVKRVGMVPMARPRRRPGPGSACTAAPAAVRKIRRGAWPGACPPPGRPCPGPASTGCPAPARRPAARPYRRRTTSAGRGSGWPRRSPK